MPFTSWANANADQGSLDRQFPVDSPVRLPTVQQRALAFDNAEAVARATYLNSTIVVRGWVRTLAGNAIPGATVQLADRSKISDVSGQYRFEDVPRDNKQIKVMFAGHHDELVTAYLRQPLSVAEVVVDPILLTPRQSNQARMLFGGDVSFGRRFIDPDESTPRQFMPPDDPLALIQVSNPLPGTLGTMQFIKPFAQTADYFSINLETPVTANTSTPHPTKDYAFFTLPTSLPALQDFGVDYATLGNNHVYDYLEAGLADTFTALQQLGLPYSGAGTNRTTAFVPHRFNLAGSNYSFVTATSVHGEEHAISYVATDVKGGAADLRETSFITDLIGSERQAGYFPIVQWHTGQEYTFEPSAYAAGRFAMAADAGAALVIAHHPHVAQGFEYDGNVLISHSLGNFIFDQDRLETMFGVLEQVDLQGENIQAARAIPMYLEDYRPRPAIGLSAGSVLRRVAEFSRGPTRLFPYNGQDWIQRETEPVASQSQWISVPVNIAANGIGMVDLRGFNPLGELSVRRVIAPALAVRLGRDLMLYGDFEDIDVDPDFFEASRWDLESDSRFACLSRAYRGVSGVCSTRLDTNLSDSIIPFRNRTRVMGEATNTPNREISLVGYIKGENAGAVSMVSRYYASVGAQEFGEEVAYTHAAGSYDWEAIAVDLNLPADPVSYTDYETQTPRANRIFIRHSPPSAGTAMAAFDEFAVVNWEEIIDNSGNTPIEVPHARDFLRVQGAPGQYTIQVEMARYVPVGGVVFVDFLFRDGFE